MRRDRDNVDPFEDIQPDKSQDIDAWELTKCAMTGCPNQSSLDCMVMTPVVGNKYVTFYVCSVCWVKYVQPWLMKF